MIGKIEDIEVNEYEELNNHKNQSKMEKTIDVSALSDKEKAALMTELQNDTKSKKQQHKDDVKAYKELAVEFVNRNIDELVSQKKSLETKIVELFDDYKAVLSMKSEAYGEKNQDSHTSTLSDGSASITIGYNVSIKFDGTEDAGVEKIKNYIATLTGEDENTKKLIKITDTFLKRHVKTGMLNPSKIIELNGLREEFNNDQFNEGMDIIVDAQIRTQNSMYVSGWKYITLEDTRKKKLEFRFTV